MRRPDLEPILVMRGNAGPFPGARLGDAIAYEFHLDPTLVPRPGTTLLERVYVLLDLGVQLSNPPNCTATTPPAGTSTWSPSPTAADGSRCGTSTST